VTPNDATANPFIAFVVGVGGTVTFRAQGSAADVTITAVAGVVYPIQTSFIRAAGTAATGIVGLN
jgi:hypothetical protein